MRAALATTVLAVAATAGGCVILTGSTDGYSLVDAGACTSAADCGDGGKVCCLVVMTSGASNTCQAGPCGGAVPVQLCSSGTECGDAGACLTQLCSIGGHTYPSQKACGTIPGCTVSQ